MNKPQDVWNNVLRRGETKEELLHTKKTAKTSTFINVYNLLITSSSQANA